MANRDFVKLLYNKSFGELGGAFGGLGKTFGEQGKEFGIQGLDQFSPQDYFKIDDLFDATGFFDAEDMANQYLTQALRLE